MRPITLSFLCLFVTLFSFQSIAACHNYQQIAKLSQDLQGELSILSDTIQTKLPRSYNLYEFSIKAQSSAYFLYFSTRSGAMPCSMTKRNFSNLQRSFTILSNTIRRFSRRRAGLFYLIENEWELVNSSFRLLSQEF